MNVLLDTDVLIDLAMDREPYSQAAGALIDALERHSGSGFMAWHSISSFYYLVAPSRGRGSAKTFLLDLAQFIQVAPATTQGLVFAGSLKMHDFEDAMQVAAALACRADVIATRNLKDYARSPITAAEPGTIVKDFL